MLIVSFFPIIIMIDSTYVDGLTKLLQKMRDNGSEAIKTIIPGRIYNSPTHAMKQFSVKITTTSIDTSHKFKMIVRKGSSLQEVCS